MSAIQIEKRDLSSQLPSWFSPAPGFKFRDADGDPCMVIGWGGWRDAKNVVHDSPFGRLVGTELEFKPCALLCAWFYKGEWYIGEVNQKKLSNSQPGWTLDQEKEYSGWR